MIVHDDMKRSDLLTAMLRCRFVLLVLPVLLWSACRTTISSTIPGETNPVITHTLPVRAWELWEDGQRLGVVVRYEDPSHPETAFFSVRNISQQELGMIDTQGRAWRHRPHQREPDWLGTGTVLSGARRILASSERAELIEVELGKLQVPGAADPRH